MSPLEDQKLSNDASEAVVNLAKRPSDEALHQLRGSESYQAYLSGTSNSKQIVREGLLGKNAQFWLRYMDLV